MGLITAQNSHWNFIGFSDGLRISPSRRRAKLVKLMVRKPHARDSHRHLTQGTVATSERQFSDPLNNVPTAEIMFLSTPQNVLADEKRDWWKNWMKCSVRVDFVLFSENTAFDLKQRIEISGNNHSWRSQGSKCHDTSNSTLQWLYLCH